MPLMRIPRIRQEKRFSRVSYAAPVSFYLSTLYSATPDRFVSCTSFFLSVSLARGWSRPRHQQHPEKGIDISFIIHVGRRTLTHIVKEVSAVVVDGKRRKKRPRKYSSVFFSYG